MPKFLYDNGKYFTAMNLTARCIVGDVFYLDEYWPYTISSDSDFDAPIII